jgi:hypothetical protein
MANYPVINIFNAGELSAKMDARRDVDKYNSGCLTLENFQILPHGGVTRRPAIEYIATAKTGKVRLIPFEFSSTQTYIMEFGEKYIRYYKDGEQVLSGASPAETVSPYSADDLWGLKYVQSADVIWFVHPDYPVYKLSRTSDTVWTMAELVPDYPPFLDVNTGAITITPSATTGSITLTASAPLFDVKHEDAYFLIKHVRTDNAQSTTDGTGAGPVAPTGTNTIAGRGDFNFRTTGSWDAKKVAVWRSIDSGTTWEKFNEYDLNGANVDASWTENEDGIIYAWTSTAAAPADATATLSVKDYYTEGIVQITGITSDTEATATVIQTLGGTSAVTTWAEGAWSEYQGYPQAVSLFENRLVFAGTARQPNTLWLSKTDNYTSWRPGSLATDALILTLGSGRIDEIRWLSPQRGLIIGTVGSEWALEAESDKKPLTPTAYSLKRKTTYGTSTLQGTMVNGAVLFMMRQGRKLRELAYQYDVDEFQAPDLTILSEHITEAGIIDASYVQQPDNMWLGVRGDGELAVLTYERDQGVVGWQRWVTDGEFESVAVIPKDNADDEIWVSALVNGARLIGRFDRRSWDFIVGTAPDWDQILFAWNERRAALGQAEVTSFDGTDWEDVLTLQQWIEDNCDEFLPADAEVDGVETWPENYTWTTLKADMGLSGWRKVASGSTTYTYGNIEATDSMGNWLRADIKTALDLLTKITAVLSTSTERCSGMWGFEDYYGCDGDMCSYLDYGDDPVPIIPTSSDVYGIAESYAETQAANNGYSAGYSAPPYARAEKDAVEIVDTSDKDERLVSSWGTDPYPCNGTKIEWSRSKFSVSVSFPGTFDVYLKATPNGTFKTSGLSLTEDQYVAVFTGVDVASESGFFGLNSAPSWPENPTSIGVGAGTEAGFETTAKALYKPDFTPIGSDESYVWGELPPTGWTGPDWYTEYEPPLTTLDGLDYLDGKEVEIVEDLVPQSRQTVSGGEVVGSAGVERTVVGLPFTATLAPMYIEPMVEFKQPMGKRKGIFKASIRLLDTMGIEMGQSLDDLVEVKFGETGLDTWDETELFTGERTVNFSNVFDRLHTCYIVQEKPLPVTVLAMVPSVEVY